MGDVAEVLHGVVEDGEPHVERGAVGIPVWAGSHLGKGQTRSSMIMRATIEGTFTG